MQIDGTNIELACYTKCCSTLVGLRKTSFADMIIA